MVMNQIQVSLLWLEKILAEIIQKQLAEQIVLPAVAADTWFLLKASEGAQGEAARFGRKIFADVLWLG